MNKLEKIELLALENFQLKSANLKLQLDAIQAEEANFSAKIKEKYDIQSGDTVDLSTGDILRAPKKE